MSNENPVWPTPKFSFSVTIGDITADFQEVSGLDNESQPIEYRHGNNPVFMPIKMPGISKTNNVSLKKGIFTNDAKSLNWFDAINKNTINPETILIQLNDESNNPVMTWTLQNAWPTKITGTDFKPDGVEVAIDTLELAFESLSISKNP